MRVVLVEDELLLREGMASLLGPPAFRSWARRATRSAAPRSATLPRPRGSTSDASDANTEGLRQPRISVERYPEVGILCLVGPAEVELCHGLLAHVQGIGYHAESVSRT